MVPLQFRVSTVLSAIALLPLAVVELTDPLLSRGGFPSEVFAWAAEGQLLPPPRNGDIRIIYWELRNESELWLTLEPVTPGGGQAPLLTVTWRFAGRRPTAPPTAFDIRAYAGAAFAPRVEFWLLLDGEHRIDLAPPGRSPGLTSGTPSDYVSHLISLETLRQVAGAQQVSGHALGFDFELTGSQRAAVANFLKRVLAEPAADAARYQ